MHIDWGIVRAGAIVGFTVGMTGMGGGALMTPILVIFFGVSPTAAVSSDLVAAMVMKPIGGGVHIRRRTVRWPLVRWLCIGSIPMAFAGVFIIHNVGGSDQVENLTKLCLGWTLLLASAAMIFKAWLQGRRSLGARMAGGDPRDSLPPFAVRIIPTVIVGLVGGLLVGLTSVGSGSIVIICLMLLYPMLRGSELVGTDLVQAIPLVAAAALAHIFVGDFQLGLTASILIGSIPAVWFGARVSSKAPDGVIRPLLVFVLAASGLKLLNMPGHFRCSSPSGALRRLGRGRCRATSEGAVGRDRARQEELGPPPTLLRTDRGGRGLRRRLLHQDPPAARGRRRHRGGRERRGGHHLMFDRIVVAIDGSREGGKTLPVAIEMAERFGSAVTVVHVREHAKYEGSDVDLGPETPADELVESALTRFREAKVEARGEIRRVNPGNTPEQIVKVAADVGADLIVSARAA